MATWSLAKLFSKSATPQERKISFIQQILLPGLSTLLVMISVELIKDKATLFFTILPISVLFVMLSYAVVKFEPLKSQAGKRALLTKMLYVVVNSTIYTLALVVILTQFLFGHEIPYFSFNYQTQVLSIYMQKVYVTIFIMLVSWATSFMIAKLVFK